MPFYFILTVMFQPPGYAMAYVSRYGTYTMAEGDTREDAFQEILKRVCMSLNMIPEKVNVMFFSLESNAPITI